MPPLVSIILPAWNAAAHVARAVRSVLAQDLQEWELLVVDDGSSDGTAGVVRAAAAGDARVRLLEREHMGIVAALQAGIAASRGPFLARMDADDEMMPARLSGQLRLLQEQPGIGVASCLVEFGGDPATARGYALHVEWINSLVDPETIALHRFVEAPLAHPTAFFRRELVERFGGYRETGGPEDYELWLRWMEAGVRFAKVPRVLLRWYDSHTRLSRTDPRYAEVGFYNCKCRYLAQWLSERVKADREIVLWGAGRITRRRFRPLLGAGVRLAGYIDIDPKKTGWSVGGLPVWPPEHLPSPGGCFVVVGVGKRGAREVIRASLEGRGFVEGRDFICAA